MLSYGRKGLIPILSTQGICGADGKLTQEEYERMEGTYKYLKWELQMKELVGQFDIYDVDYAGKEEASSVQYHCFAGYT
ncbi:MAG: hypothetical protein NC416_17890 [Eubacterium sp.]|nr:hypothetical protein [Eubacterium sp.]